MKPHTTARTEPTPVDLAEAELEFLATRSALAAIPEDAVRVVNINVSAAAVHALGLYDWAQTDAVRPRFANVARSGEWSEGAIDDLRRTALAAYWAASRYAASAAASEAKVPFETVKTATNLRAKMLRCVEYNLDDKPEVEEALVVIRPGSGHLDLVSDLLALAKLYTGHAAALADDRKRYRATDARKAITTANEIRRAIGTAEHDGVDWSDFQLRAFTRLVAAFDEVGRAGRFVFPAESNTRFRSLVSALRAAPHRESSRPGRPAERDSRRRRGGRHAGGRVVEARALTGSCLATGTARVSSSALRHGDRRRVARFEQPLGVPHELEHHDVISVVREHRGPRWVGHGSQYDLVRARRGERPCVRRRG